MRMPYYCGWVQLLGMRSDFVRRPEQRWVSLCGCCNCCAKSACGCIGCSPACCYSIPVMEWLKPDAEFTLIISHGNGQDLQYLANDIVPRLAGLKISVNIVCYEYPGYSLSPLPTSEGLCLAAADVAYGYVRYQLGIPPHQIVMYGISLGTGPAVHIAAKYDVGGMILQSPYTSIGATKVGLSWAKRLCCIDLFRSYSLASSVRAPVLMYHGAIDDVVPAQCTRELAPLFPAVFDQPVYVNKAGHNDLIESLENSGKYLPMIETYLYSLAKKGSSAPKPMTMGAVG